MMNKRHRHLLHDLEHELEWKHPAWVRQFMKSEPASRTLNRPHSTANAHEGPRAGRRCRTAIVNPDTAAVRHYGKEK